MKFDKRKTIMEDLEDYLVLRDLGSGSPEYGRFKYWAEIGKIKSIKTERGLAVNKNDLAAAIRHPSKNRSGKHFNPQVNLEDSKKLKCLYWRLASFSKKNYDKIRGNSNISRYTDENGNVCISIKDYIQPQIKVLAKKLECRESAVYQYLYDLLKFANDKIEKRNGNKDV